MPRSRASRSSGVLGLDEMRHVGDVHAEQPVAVLGRLERDRVVEIAGVDRVDRDDRLVRSSRAGPPSRSRRTARPAWRASSSTSSGNSSGRSNSRMIDSVSTPGWPRGPSTSVMTPSPRWSCDGKRTISKTTLSSGLALLAPGRRRESDRENGLPSILHDRPCRRVSKYVPTNWLVCALDDFDDAPSGLGRRVSCLVFRRTSTVSPVAASTGVIGGDEDILFAIGAGRAALGSHEAETFFRRGERRR